MEEIWKKIDGFSNYEVSNLGRVRNLKRNTYLKGGTNPKGYKSITIQDDSLEYKTFSLHKLVALLFIPNPNNYSEINHIDENKSNNCADNLEWCTRSYNINYGTRNDNLKKPIIQYSLSGKYIKEWDSISTASRDMNLDRSSISLCCLGVYRKSQGYIWRYK